MGQGGLVMGALVVVMEPHVACRRLERHTAAAQAHIVA